MMPNMAYKGSSYNNHSSPSQGYSSQYNHSLMSSISTSPSLSQKLSQGPSLQIRITYIYQSEDPQKEYSYVQGHDGVKDIQLKFWSRTAREKFSFIRIGGAYIVSNFKYRNDFPLYYVDIDEDNTQITEDKDADREIPELSPEITSEEKKDKIFCKSLSELSSQQYCSILGRYLGQRLTFQRETQRRGIKIFFEISHCNVVCVVLWGKRCEGYNFQKDQYIVWRHLQKVGGRFDLKLSCFSSFLILKEDQIGSVPQTRLFETCIPFQEPERIITSIKERQDEIFLPKISDIFTVELEDASDSIFYQGCALKNDGIECRTKTEKYLNGWKCGKGHLTTQEPIRLFRLRIKVHAGSLVSREAAFLCDKAEQLFGIKAAEIYQLDHETRKEILQNKLKGKLFYLTLHPSFSNEYSFEWKAYEVLSLDD